MTCFISKYWNILGCLLLICSITGSPLLGQTIEEDYQNQSIEQKKFEDTGWKNLQEALDYSGERPEPEEKPETPKPWDFSLPDISPFVKIFGFILLISLIGLIMYHVINNVNQKIKPDKNTALLKNKTELLSLEELEEQLDKQDVNPYILQAEKQHNFPLAVRLHFLALLKKMNEQEYIDWRKNHTNNTYLNQMRGKDSFTNFKQLTQEYERVWYGDRHPTQREYEYIKNHFNKFHLTLDPITST